MAIGMVSPGLGLRLGRDQRLLRLLQDGRLVEGVGRGRGRAMSEEPGEDSQIHLSDDSIKKLD